MEIKLRYIPHAKDFCATRTFSRIVIHTIITFDLDTKRPIFILLRLLFCYFEWRISHQQHKTPLPAHFTLLPSCTPNNAHQSLSPPPPPPSVQRLSPVPTISKPSNLGPISSVPPSLRVPFHRHNNPLNPNPWTLRRHSR